MNTGTSVSAEQARGPIEQLASGFPEDPWEVLDVRASPAFERELEGMLSERLIYHGAPRDMHAVDLFLREHLPPGRVLVYGAGTHSTHLLARLCEHPALQVVGLVDKWAGRSKDAHGLPLWLPEAVPALLDAGEADYVLLSSPLWEMQMRAALLFVDVPLDKIQMIYADPRYAQLATQAAQHLLELLPESSEFVLVDFAREGQVLIDDRELETILPRHRTLRLHSERFEQLTQGSSFASHGFRNSISLLRSMLERLQPKLVYLRTFIDDSLMSALISSVLPNARLLHEAYDFSITVPKRFLCEGYGHSERSIQMAHSGEAHSFRRADYVIGKRGGQLWERVLHGQSAAYASYFAQLPSQDPALPASAPDAPRDGSELRIIYAGNLPSEEVLGVEMANRLLPLFKQLSQVQGLCFSLFNGAHRLPSEDAQFAYVQRLVGERVAYHAALPYEEILRQMQQHHYGWLYVPREKIDFIDEQVLVSNRFTGYLCAGLPLIIDDGWDRMASLVREFDAGMVVSMRHPEALEELLASADVERHRRGALALREHMRQANRSVLKRLQACIGS